MMMDQPRCRHVSSSKSSRDALPPCSMKSNSVTLMRCPGDASISHGHDARPTPDSSVVTLDKNPESGVNGCPPYNEQTWDVPDFTRHASNELVLRQWYTYQKSVPKTVTNKKLSTMLCLVEYFAKSLKVIRKCTIRKLGYGFLFAFHGCILYHLRDKAIYWSIAVFSNLHSTPLLGEVPVGLLLYRLVLKN